MKTKALVSFAVVAVAAKLICVFVFAYAKSQFSHDVVHIYSVCKSFLAFIFSLGIAYIMCDLDSTSDTKWSSHYTIYHRKLSNVSAVGIVW